MKLVHKYVQNKDFIPIDDSKRKIWLPMSTLHCEKVYKTPSTIKKPILVKNEGTATQKHSFGTYSK